ncbi:MAG: hypothetical protein U0625_06725 [Phycisphaerales bacterium]
MTTLLLAPVVLALTPPMPLQPVSATGSSWVIATASGVGNIYESRTLVLGDLLKGFESDVVATGTSSVGTADTHARLLRGGLGWRLIAGGGGDTSVGGGQSAFSRADVSASVEFTLERAGRIGLAWDLGAYGISSGNVRLVRLPVVAGSTLSESWVSSYIVPDLNSGSAVLELPAGSYRLQASGTTQCNSGFANPDTGRYDLQVDLVALDAPDLNGDGAIDGADLGLLLAGWGTADADLNGDGTTDGADLGLLLAQWGN